MSDDRASQPAALGMGLQFGDEEGPFPIGITGELILTDGKFSHCVSLRIRRGDNGVRLILDAENARALRDDLDASLEDAREKLKDQLNQEGST